MFSKIIYILWTISIVFIFCETYIAPFFPLKPKKEVSICPEGPLVYLWLLRNRILWESHRNPVGFANFPSCEVEATGHKTPELDLPILHECSPPRWPGLHSPGKVVVVSGKPIIREPEPFPKEETLHSSIMCSVIFELCYCPPYCRLLALCLPPHALR